MSEMSLPDVLDKMTDPRVGARDQVRVEEDDLRAASTETYNKGQVRICARQSKKSGVTDLSSMTSSIQHPFPPSHSPS